jgi:hypothetical protein
MIAAGAGYKDIVLILINKGADINQQRQKWVYRSPFCYRKRLFREPLAKKPEFCKRLD